MQRRRAKKRVDRRPHHVFARATAQHDVVFEQQEMMIRRRQIDVTGLDHHAVLGLHHRHPRGRAHNRRQNPDPMRGDMQDHEHRRRKVGREPAKNVFQRRGRA